jgi:hypothetical protein
MISELTCHNEMRNVLEQVQMNNPVPISTLFVGLNGFIAFVLSYIVVMEQYCSVSRSSYFVRPLASTALNVRTQENPYPHPCLPNPGGLSQIWLTQSWGLGGLTERYCLIIQKMPTLGIRNVFSMIG